LVSDKDGERQGDRQDHPFFHLALVPESWIRRGRSTPPEWKGWHLPIRRIPSSTPRIGPFSRIDPIMYSEQLGWNLQQLPV